VKAFRLLALAYALSALLIAPAWLTADEVVPAEEPAAAPAEPGAEPAPAPAPPEPGQFEEPAPAAEPAPEEPPVVVAQEPDEPTDDKPASAKAAQEEKDKGPVAKAAASASVTISDFKFSPSSVTVNVGDTVTWSNDGPTVHTATANDGSFDTGILNKGESGSATFDQAGTISYICTPHPNMKGTIVVQAASAGSGGSDDTAGAAEDDPVATTADDDGLPATGGETLAIALLGLATLGAGLLLRRRDQIQD
jgi:LPXTG-motif cell wall-anchored protein